MGHRTYETAAQVKQAVRRIGSLFRFYRSVLRKAAENPQSKPLQRKAREVLKLC